MPAIDQARASLTRFDPSSAPRSAVLLLHGGTEFSEDPVGPLSASWQVMRSLQRAFEETIDERGLATSVWLLRYRQRGWNGGSPRTDARWALATLADELGDVPVSLVGHSMGGRTAIHVADHPSVTGVVALAPWVPPDTPVSTLAGRRFVAAHGSHDKITPFASTRSYVERARAVADDVRFVDMGPVGHYLLRDRRHWWEVATTEALAMVAAQG